MIGWLPALAALIAAVGLFWPQRPVTVGPGGAAILLFDITQSMNVADMSIAGRPVSRMEFARESAHIALDKLPCGTALGAGILAAHRALVLLEPVEVCRHRVELHQVMSFIGPGMAWQGNSEIAKGYYAGLRIAADMTSTPALVLLSDGHEAPPINPLHRPPWDPPDHRGAALVGGIGGRTPAPIPKTDPTGRSLGTWGPDDVMQIDTYTRGRGGSAVGEKLVETDTGKAVDARVVSTPGSEHLSALREPYLQLLADETNAGYIRLSHTIDLHDALVNTVTLPGLEALNARRIAAGLALAVLVAYYANRLLGRSTRAVAPRK